MALIYLPKHQPQLGRGTPVPGATRGSMDCGVRTVQVGIDKLTNGQLVPSVTEIRTRMGRPGAQPTNTSNADQAVESYGAQMARIDRRGLDYDKFRGPAFESHIYDAIKRGDGVQMAIDYGVFNRRMKRRGEKTGDPNFTGGHSQYIIGFRRTRVAETFLFDSLDDKRRAGIPDGPRWVPLSPILEAWEAFGHFFGIFRGGERTL
jgi:hypothetical protein